MRAAIGQTDECGAALSRILGPDLKVGSKEIESLLDLLGVSRVQATTGLPTIRGVPWSTRPLRVKEAENFIGARHGLLQPDSNL